MLCVPEVIFFGRFAIDEDRRFCLECVISSDIEDLISRTLVDRLSYFLGLAPGLLETSPIDFVRTLFDFNFFRMASIVAGLDGSICSTDERGCSDELSVMFAV